MPKRQNASLMLLVLYMILILVLLVLVAAGARLYGSVLDARNRHEEQRGALAYIQSQVNGMETGMRLKDGPEGTMLCIQEPDGSYENRIYLYRGALCTRLCSCTDPLLPELAERICTLGELTMTLVSSDLLEVSADGRTAWVHCAGGDAVG